MELILNTVKSNIQNCVGSCDIVTEIIIEYAFVNYKQYYNSPQPVMADLIKIEKKNIQYIVGCCPNLSNIILEYYGAPQQNIMDKTIINNIMTEFIHSVKNESNMYLPLIHGYLPLEAKYIDMINNFTTYLKCGNCGKCRQCAIQNYKFLTKHQKKILRKLMTKKHKIYPNLPSDEWLVKQYLNAENYIFDINDFVKILT
jgi:hypothetical protein